MVFLYTALKCHKKYVEESNKKTEQDRNSLISFSSRNFIRHVGIHFSREASEEIGFMALFYYEHFCTINGSLHRKATKGEKFRSIKIKSHVVLCFSRLSFQKLVIHRCLLLFDVIRKRRKGLGVISGSMCF